MNTFQYISAAGLCLAMTWLTSAILFRKGTDFRIQRAFIIVSVILSLVLPLSQFRIEMPDRGRTIVELPFAAILNSTDTDAHVINPEEPGFFASSAGYLVRLYYIIIAVWLLALLLQIARILLLYFVSDRQKRGSLTILTGSRIKTPFSFFSLVFIPGDIDDEAERESIIIHESIHASQYHSFDNLLIELLTAVMWFNPFVWMIRRSLHLVHEYLADEGALVSGIDRIRYQALLINQVAEERLICLSSDFNNKLLKKRMIMMTKNTSMRRNNIKILTLLPLTGSLLIMVALLNGFFPAEAKAEVTDNNTSNLYMLEMRAGIVIQQETTRNKPAIATGTVIQQDTSKSKTVVKIRGVANDKKSGTNEIKVVGYGDSKSSQTVVYIVDGVKTENITGLDPETIESIDVLKENNLIVIRTKKPDIRQVEISGVANKPVTISKSSSLPDNILFVVDGDPVDKSVFESLDPAQIESISVLKDGYSGIKKYTDRTDIDGIIIVKTKK